MQEPEKYLSLAKAARTWPGGPISRTTCWRFVTKGVCVQGRRIVLESYISGARRRRVKREAIQRFIDALHVATTPPIADAVAPVGIDESALAAANREFDALQKRSRARGLRRVDAA